VQIFNSPPIRRTIELLSGADLPFSDLTGDVLENFFGCGDRESPNGIVGLEIRGKYALLRSLVVAEVAQNQGCGRALVQQAETHARHKGVETLYLLTETAESFFQNLGYEVCQRNDVPEPICRTEEFSSLCPDSAIVMKKNTTESTRNVALDA
jgi:amino-acid N-acetyltransferase